MYDLFEANAKFRSSEKFLCGVLPDMIIEQVLKQSMKAQVGLKHERRMKESVIARVVLTFNSN